jgi:hypothetical protein
MNRRQTLTAVALSVPFVATIGCLWLLASLGEEATRKIDAVAVLIDHHAPYRRLLAEGTPQ